MLSDEIKKEFLKKIAETLEIVLELKKFEKQSGLSSDELINQSNNDYIKLLDKSTEIGNKMSELLVHTKYFPLLIGLNKYIIGEKGKVRLKEFIEAVVKIKGKDIKEKDIEIFLEDIFENKKDEMKRRMQKIDPLILDIHLNVAIKYLYEEIVRCYVWGCFKASCALCRVIAESIAKKYIIDRGYGDLLKDRNDLSGKISIPNILRNKLSVSTEILELYSKIIGKADNILHNKDEKADEEDALSGIKSLNLFIEKFPRAV